MSLETFDDNKINWYSGKISGIDPVKMAQWEAASKADPNNQKLKNVFRLHGFENYE